MFKKLKDKIAEEVKISPQRMQQIQQFTQSVTDKLQQGLEQGATSPDDGLFSISEDDTKTDAGLTNVPLVTTSIPELPHRIRRNSNSSIGSDVSFLPRYESTMNSYHLQSDLDDTSSELEDNVSQQSSSLGQISKEQVHMAFKKAQMGYHKYRGHYTDLANHYKELEREYAKVKSLLVKTQDKAFRRFSELREQCSLSQRAKADLESALRVEIEEKQIVIDSLKQKVSLLQSGAEINGNDGLSTPSTPSTTTSTSASTPITNGTQFLNLNNSNEELINDLNEKVQEYKANSIVSKEKLTTLQKQLEDANRKVVEFEEREKNNNLKFAKSKMDLHTELQNRELEIGNLKQDLETMRIDLESYEKGGGLKAQNVNLIEKIEILKSKNHELEAELLKTAQYKLELQDLRPKLAQFEFMQTKLQETESDLFQMKANLEEDRQKHEEMLRELKSKHSEELKALQEETKQGLLSLQDKIQTSLFKEYEQKEGDLRKEFEVKLDELNKDGDSLKQIQIRLLQTEDALNMVTESDKESKVLVSILEEKNTQLESNYIALMDENNNKQKEVVSLKENIRVLEGKIEEEIKSRKVHDEEKSVLTSEVKKLEDEIKTLNNESIISQEAYKNKAHEFINEIKLLELLDVKDANLKSDAEIARITNLLSREQLKENETGKEVAELKNKLQSLDNERKLQKEANISLRNELEMLQHDIDSKNQEIRHKHEENEEISNTNDELLNKLKETDEKLLNFEDTIEKLNENTEKLIKNKEIVLKESIILQEKVTVLQTDLESRNKQFESDNEAISQLKDEIRLKNNELSMKIDEISLKNEEIANLSMDFDVLEQQIQQKIQENAKLIENNTSLSDRLHDSTRNLEKLHAEEDNLRKESNSLREQVNSLQSDLETKNKQLETEEIAELKKQLTTKNDEISKNNHALSAKIDEISLKNEEISILTRDLEGLQQKVQQMTQEHHDKLIDNAKETNEAHITFEKSVKKLEEDKEILLKDNNLLQEKLKTLTKDLENRNKQFESENQEIIELRQQLITKNEEVLLKQEEISTLNFSLISLNDLISTKEEQLEELQLSITKSKETNDIFKVQLEDLAESSKTSEARWKTEKSQLITQLEELSSRITTNSVDTIDKGAYDQKCVELSALEQLLRQKEEESLSLLEDINKAKHLHADILSQQETSNKTIDTLSNETQSLQSRNDQLSSDNKRLMDENDKLLAESSDIMLQLATKITNTDAEVAAKLQDVTSQYSEALLEAQTARDQLERIKKETSCLNSGQQQYEKQISDLEKHVSELEQERQLFLDEIDELKTTPINITSTSISEKDVVSLQVKLAQYKSIDQTNRSSIEFYENELQRLQLKNEKLNRKLDETLVTLNHCADLSASTEVEYLKNVLYNYMLGKESIVLARVIAAVCKFDRQQTETVLKHEQHKQSLLGQLGIL